MTQRRALRRSSSRTACSSATRRPKCGASRRGSDLLECVLGLGPGLFYNSPMEACVVICRTRKDDTRAREGPVHRRCQQVVRERGQSFLAPENQERILAAYQAFVDDPGFAKVTTIAEVLDKDCNLSIRRYVRPVGERPSNGSDGGLNAAWAAIDSGSGEFWAQMDVLVETLGEGLSGSRRVSETLSGWTRTLSRCRRTGIRDGRPSKDEDSHLHRTRTSRRGSLAVTGGGAKCSYEGPRCG